jgi:hypothetical protein
MWFKIELRISRNWEIRMEIRRQAQVHPSPGKPEYKGDKSPFP